MRLQGHIPQNPWCSTAEDVRRHHQMISWSSHVSFDEHWTDNNGKMVDNQKKMLQQSWKLSSMQQKTWKQTMPKTTLNHLMVLSSELLEFFIFQMSCVTFFSFSQVCLWYMQLHQPGQCPIVNAAVSSQHFQMSLLTIRSFAEASPASFIDAGQMGTFHNPSGWGLTTVSPGPTEEHGHCIIRREMLRYQNCLPF